MEGRGCHGDPRISAEVAAVVGRFREGRSTQADLAPCREGDGGCGDIPLLSPGCVLEGCRVGRWRYSCEMNNGKTISMCEVPRDYNNPPDAGCWLMCETDRAFVECRTERTERLLRKRRDGG